MSFRRPRLIVLIATVLFVALTVRLGFWQLGRGLHKAELAELRAAQALKPVAPWQGELGETAWQRRFSVRGVWRPEGQIFLDNRVRAGQAGFHVLAPLQLADGRWLLVNRGWLLKRPGVVPQAPLPAGEQVLTVRFEPPAQHYVELAGDTAAGAVWQNLDWTRYRARTQAPLVAALAWQLDGADPLARDWPAPGLGIEKHYAYAGQWFLFAALAAFLFIFLHWKRRSE
ncbi:SURF1 family protein [Chitinimonas koreensis]|uniref:SURF1 family protein n=1 Tax=Chitinimonas koreensis TaxID=356302 RepID=UPI00041FC5A4|nr:SURF1 family protein [Chitinimonas koreensis]QNM96091.1 SURF1 family protein [Chitinimonas koreensis]